MSGKSWLLQRTAGAAENGVWLPIIRLDNDDAVARWREQAEAQKKAAREQAYLHDKNVEKEVALTVLKDRLKHIKSVAKDPSNPQILDLEKNIELLETSPGRPDERK